MKKLIVILVSSICLLIPAFAQEFSMKLYFEAANGEKDTLEIGYDENATAGVDVIFGEVDYGTPINRDKFQVFATDNGYFLKKQIVKKYPMYNNFYSYSEIQMLIPENAYPITIKWDKTQFSAQERRLSTISDNGTYIECPSTFSKDMNLSSSIIVSDWLTSDNMFCEEDTYTDIFEGVSFHKIYVNFYGYYYTSDLHNVEFDVTEIEKIDIYTISGQKRLTFQNERIKDFDMQNLPKGIYIMVLESKNKKKSYSKLIKN